MNNYTDTLRAHNLKATPQRIEIANVLHKEGHISIEKLYETMLKKFNSISLATIYKNINIMTDAAFIQEVKIPNEKSVYELSMEAHSHLSCKKCGKVEDIILDLSDVTKNATKSSHYKIDKVSLVLSGLCKECQ